MDEADWLGADLTHLALLWRIVRRDGIALGFTTHDRPLTRAGLRHESAPGMAPSAVVTTAGFDVDTMEVEGALTADAITAADLGAGRYDGAALALTLVDWRDPDGPALLLTHGTLSGVSIGSGGDPGFTATLRGPLAALEAPAVAICAPECRAEFGDPRCRVPLRQHRQTHVLAAAGAMLAIPTLTDPGACVGGMVRLLDGDGAGGEQRVVEVVDGDLRLEAPLAAEPGARVELTAGCDRRFATCRDRFRNAANFRGEPHVPGGDLLARFGGF